MKIAYTLNGLVGGFMSTENKSMTSKDNHKSKKSSEKSLSYKEESLLTLKYCTKFLKKYVLDNNDIDIFIFSWEVDKEEEFKKYLNPKKIKLIPQIDFEIPEHLKGKNDRRVLAHYSRWYGFKEVMKLKKEYEKENNFKYDCVMLARFDLAWQTDLIFEDYDQKYFWVGKWPKKWFQGKELSDLEYWKISDGGKYSSQFETTWWGYPHNDQGLLGMWFFSNSENMSKFTTLYDCLDEYSLPNRCPLDVAGQISAHQQSLYHLEQLGLKDNLRFTEKNWHDDAPTVRRKYFKEK